MLSIVVTLSLMSMSLPQSYCRIIFEDDSCTEWNCLGNNRLDRLILFFCDVYGRVPEGKKELLQFHKERCRFYGKYDYPKWELSDRQLSKVLRIRKNKMWASGDTCFFYSAKTKWTYQVLCQLRDDKLFNYPTFRESTRYPFCFNKSGRYIWIGAIDAPWKEILKKNYKYYVAFESILKGGPNSYDSDMGYGYLKLPLLVQFTYEREKGMAVDLRCVEDRQLFYGEIARINVFESKNLQEASKEMILESSFFDEMEQQLKSYLEKHPDIYMIKSWELLLFD